ncbi:MAG: chemotaxis protein CheW [Spirochaeta sp.]|nr:chemotaxis protein CheW [Spirochaeta sp.]
MDNEQYAVDVAHSQTVLEYAEIRPMIIVLDTPFEDGRITMGATADSVNEVVDIEQSSIEKPPSIGTSVDTSFIQGIGKKDDDFIIILRSARIFRDEELAALNTEVST